MSIGFIIHMRKPDISLLKNIISPKILTRKVFERGVWGENFFQKVLSPTFLLSLPSPNYASDEYRWKNNQHPRG